MCQGQSTGQRIGASMALVLIKDLNAKAQKMLTEDQMRKINDERRRKGQSAITRDQAEKAARDAGYAGNGALEFCLGLSGVPWPSAMGVAGFMLHAASSASPSHADTTPSAPEPSAPDTSSSFSSDSGGSFGGGGGDSSY